MGSDGLIRWETREGSTGAPIGRLCLIICLKLGISSDEAEECKKGKGEGGRDTEDLAPLLKDLYSIERLCRMDTPTLSSTSARR